MKKEGVVCSTVVFLLLLLSSPELVCGKRAFAIRMRGKSNSNSGLSRYSRKNYHNAHMSDNVSGGMVRNPPVPDVQAPRPGVGLNVDSAGPMGPPPAYPALAHHVVPVGGAPPAYSRIAPPSYAEAIGYSSHGHNYGLVASPGRHYDYNTNHNNLHNAYSENNIAGYGSNYGYHRGSNPFSVGNILTGVALWHLGHGLASTGHQKHHDYYQNYYNKNENPEDNPGSTIPPEIENPHIQVNADFDFGPSPAPTVEPALQTTTEPALSTVATSESPV